MEKELYVDYDDLDFIAMRWVTVWEPTSWDVDLEKVIKRLLKIAPDIHWRIQSTSPMNAVVVPFSQEGDADTIIGLIRNATDRSPFSQKAIDKGLADGYFDISRFHSPKDLVPSLYNKKGKLRREIIDFRKAISDLNSFIHKGYSTYSDAPKVQIKSLIMSLSNLYAAGARLAFLEIHSDFDIDWYYDHPDQNYGGFPDEMWQIYSKYLVDKDYNEEDYDEKDNPFWVLQNIPDELEQIIARHVERFYADENCRIELPFEELDINWPHRVARVVKCWQNGFRFSGGWGANSLAVLKDLHLIQERIGDAKYDKKN